MNDTQFYIAIAIAHGLSLLIILTGIILQNVNLNARLGELRTNLDGRFTDTNNRIGDLVGRFTDTNNHISDLCDSLLAEMAKNHSEMLRRFDDIDGRLARLEDAE